MHVIYDSDDHQTISFLFNASDIFLIAVTKVIFFQ